MKKYPFWIVLIVLLTIWNAAAQDAVCPPSALLSFARSGSACFGLERDQVCYGNGAAGATFQEGLTESAFVQPGDKISLGQVASIGVSPAGEDVSVANLLIQASLSDTEANSVALLLFGDAALENHVPYLPEVAVTAT